MKNISFTSRIKPVTLNEFASTIAAIPSKNSVNYPWTLKESIKAKDVYTTNIFDCSSCLISDGEEAVLMHLNPNTEMNHVFSRVITFLRGKLDLKSENLQAVLLGSKNNQKSLDIYNKFKTLLQQLNIPYTELKNGKTPTSVAYKSTSDEVFISNRTIDKMLKKGDNTQESLKSGFEKISIADCDEIVNK